MDNICGIIHQRIRLSDSYPAMAQPQDNQGSLDEDFFDYVPDELIQQSVNSFYHLSRFVSATEATMRFSTVLPRGGSAIASSSQPVSCSNSNSNGKDVTNITNMANIENTGLVDGRMIVDGAMSLQD
jgi:hypothetical protein